MNTLNSTLYSAPLMRWFNENKRSMPWRNTTNPYYIWISEVMLQQTQVATVIPYYIRFIERFPTVNALASASLDEVHNYWQGLGYYRRGENLWKGSKMIVEKWQGIFPTDPTLIKEIPGIGPYTLGAICSIAFNLPLPSVDGNVMRVISRWYCLKDDIAFPKSRKIFEQKVMENMPSEPRIFNQALMELGALICTPTSPKCEICPVCRYCLAYKQNSQLEYPVKSKKAKKTEEAYILPIIKKGDTFLMVKRPPTGLLAHLWGFPMISKEDWETLPESIKNQPTLATVSHIFTHRVWKMIPVIIPYPASQIMPLIESQLKTEYDYIHPDAFDTMAISTAFKKVIKELNKKIS